MPVVFSYEYCEIAFLYRTPLVAAFIKKKLLQLVILLSQRLQRRCFPVNNAKCFRTIFCRVHPRRCLRNMAELITEGTYFGFSTTPVQKQPQEVFYKKVVLKNFGNFTEKQLCWSLLFDETSGQCFPVKFAKILRTPILNSICERLLLSVLFSEAYLGVPPTSHTKSYVPKVLEEVVKIFSIMCFITIFCKFCVYSK